MSIHSDSNRAKIIKGNQIKEFIKEELDDLMTSGVISSYDTEVNFPHRNYSYSKQYLANFIINTIDNKKLIVRSSSSFRGDRAKIGFYDIDGIFNNSDISKEIIASIYLVPDSELQEADFIRARSRIRNAEYYSPATHLFTVSEFTTFLENYRDTQLNKLQEIYEEKKFKTLSEAGSFYGKEGNRVEKEITALFNSSEFFKEYKEGKTASKYSQVIDFILEKYQIERKYLIAIRATNSIPLLLSGGNPKSDIYLEIFSDPYPPIQATISVKNTDKKVVTCHDYTATDFIRVLKCEKTRLADYINLFQQYPSLSALRDNLPESYSEEEFSRLMWERRDILSEWCLKGIHDPMNIVDSKKQISQFLLINSTNEFSIHKIDDYINYITKVSNLTYSTPFSWTYPSKQRGKRIQLKVPIYHSIK